MDKIMLRLTVVDDYPPVSSEGVWAQLQPCGHYRIDNIPFYSRELCWGDEVQVRVADDGLKWFERVIRASTNSTLRLVFHEPGHDEAQQVLQHLVALGCSWEGLHRWFYALNVPAEVSLDQVLDYLHELGEQGWLDYEHGVLRQ
ncbi:hypothetical protein P308_12945 [Pseudomonas piscis]|nr:hypothetical protein P308_12945 [Pseudomonas piscis]